MFKKIIFLYFLIFSTIALGQDFVIDSFHSSIIVNQDGIVNVNEQIFVDFSKEKRGIYRLIPYRFSKNGNEYITEISNVSVQNHLFKSTKKSGNIEIKIGHKDRYLNGKQVYNISYDVKGPFIDSKDFQEFYWNITGNDWKAPINSVKYDIMFPDSIALSENIFAVYTGMENEKNMAATISKFQNKISGYSTKPFTEGEGITVAIKMPAGYIDEQNTMQEKLPKAPIPISDQWPLTGAVGLLLAGFIAFWKKLRGQKSEQEIVPKPYPPLDLTPAEVGAFYDHIVHDRDVISMLPYWANQGYISMSYDQSTNETRIKKLKELDKDRPPYEYTLFDAIFSFGDELSLADLKHNFYEQNQKVKSQIKKEILDLEMYDENYRFWFKSWRIWILIPILIPMFIASFIMGYWLVGVAVIIGIVIVIVFSSISNKLSEKGHRVKADLKGFYSFLKADNSKEYEAIVNKDPQYFEKVYPYAVAFNMDKNFINKIKPYQNSAPFWYGFYGMNHNNESFSTFTDNFSPKEIKSAFTSYPSGGSSSGSVGGGFSGGGFGGGGGGSW
jgi:uncharacterized membrane protein YgcG